MSESKSSRVGAAYTYTPLSSPLVRGITEARGQYVVDFGARLKVHVTAAEWDTIDNAVRAGIAALIAVAS